MRDTAWAVGLLVLVAAVALAAGASLLLEAPAHAAGTVHPQFETMDSGGVAHARHGELVRVGVLTGTLLLVLIVALMAFAYRQPDRLRIVAPWLAGALLLHVAALAMIFWTYRGTMDDRAPAIIMAFPTSTSWLLYALVPAKFLFIIIFLATFDRAYWRPEDEWRLRELLTSKDDDL